MKTVDASKDGVTLIGATLSVVGIELVTRSPVGEVVPFWLMKYELKAGPFPPIPFVKQVPYQANTDALQVAELSITAADLTGWDVTRFE